MKKEQTKMITVYSKNGNPLVIKESLKGSFVGRGYSTEQPKPKPETTAKEESK